MLYRARPPDGRGRTDIGVTLWRRRAIGVVVAVATATAGLTSVTSVVTPTIAEAASNIPMYRLYNLSTAEHFYTGDLNEATLAVANGGWKSEGIGWWAPPTGTGSPVYRLNAKPGTGSAGHLYTTSTTERTNALNSGQWLDEGIGWYSSGTIPVYRENNPKTGQHNFTADWNEHNVLTTRQGWANEGIAWYGMQAGNPSDQTVNDSVAAYKAQFQCTYTATLTDAGEVTVIDELPRVPSDLADTYAAAFAVAQNQPDDFGHPAVEDGTVVLPAVSSSAQALSKADRKAAAKQLREYAKTLRKDGTVAYDPSIDVTSLIALSVSPGKRSARQLGELNNAIFGARNDPSLKGGGIRATGIDHNGRVVVTMTKLTPGLASSLVKKYGARDIVIQVDPGFQASLTYSRDKDTPYYAGGAAISVPAGGCSDAFAWSSGYDYMMLTAGHCAPNGGTVYAPGGVRMGTVTSSSEESWNAGVGTVAMNGSTALRGDIALIRLDSGVKSTNMMYRGGPTSSTLSRVVEMWNRAPQDGDQFCTGGWKSGEICGWTVDQTDAKVDYYDEHGVFEGTLLGGTRGYRNSASGIIGGDSGGSVFTVRPDGTIAARGVISGQQTRSGPGCSGPLTRVYFTDILQAFYGLPGSLVVTAT